MSTTKLGVATPSFMRSTRVAAGQIHRIRVLRHGGHRAGEVLGA